VIYLIFVNLVKLVHKFSVKSGIVLKILYEITHLFPQIMLVRTHYIDILNSCTDNSQIMQHITML